ncbi:MFS transporter [Micromonospora sp. NPDC050980]|uniref:MFS transporter n=1 Tax=Micromonospora sp. NPDC050980 TaxID=3155161 RepID=UPI00340016DC
MTARPPAAARSALTVVTGGSASGWRLGVLYGPAVYGVSAAAVALPDTARHLHVTGAALAWILTAYAAGVGVGAVTAGRLADARGTRQVLLCAATLLATGALVCTVAPTLGTVVIGRVVLAVGSGAVIATALTSMAQLPPSHRPAALAAVGACLAGSSATAPLAGAIASHWSWRAALVLPVLSLAAVPLCWPLTAHAPRRNRVDWPAAGLLAVVAAGLLLTAQHATGKAGASIIVIGTVTTVAAAVSLVIRQRTHPDRLLGRYMLFARWFRHAATTGACVYAGLFTVLYAAPHLLSHQSHSTMSIGLLLLPGAVVGAAIAWAAARSARRLPAGRVLAAASLLQAAALSYAAADPRTWAVAAASTAAFTASAVAQTLLTAQTTFHTAVELRGGAIGLLSLVLFLGGGCGAAFCAALWQTSGPATALTVIAALPTVGAALAWTSGHGARQVA